MCPPIHLHVTPGDDAPIYRQIVRQVVDGIATGSLTAGERLPSIRALAGQLVVAPLTVKKAYDVLETEGVIETLRGKGTFVRKDVVADAGDAAERLRPLARRLVLEAETRGFPRERLAQLIADESEALEQERRARLSGEEKQR